MLIPDAVGMMDVPEGADAWMVGCFERTIRGLNGELDLVKVAEFQPTRRAETASRRNEPILPSTSWRIDKADGL